MHAVAMARPLLLFAHGAGAPSSSAWMVRYAEALGRFAKVVAFDYPYMRAGRKTPDRLPKLVAAHAEQLALARAGHRGPLLLIGKSMGGRVGCHVSLEHRVDGVVCLGYPLVGMNPRAPLRDQVLLSMSCPVLFVQGTRDKLCPLDLLAGVRRRMSARNELHVVDGGDHSLELTKTRLAAQETTQAQVDAHVVEAVRAFVGSLEPS